MNTSEVTQRIQKLQRMSDLPPAEFSEEGGLADSLAIEFKDKLKPTQLRKVFTEIKRVRRDVERQGAPAPEAPFDRARLLKLMPTLAYAVGRDLLPRGFYDILKLSFGQERLKTTSDFLRSADFVEAILAYHKFHSRS
jgi:CRISPR type III-A-associated protein Csm2